MTATTPFNVRTTWRNDNPNTIWNRLAEHLGREPTDMEAAAEVKRILQEDAREAREELRTRWATNTPD